VSHPKKWLLWTLAWTKLLQQMTKERVVACNGWISENLLARFDAVASEQI
jgi:hypothetical protein